MRRLIYSLSAQQDFHEITRYITRESGSLSVAQKFIARLKKHCAKLATLPGTLGTARPELRADIRSQPFQGYVIFFRYSEDTLEIVNILEGHRDSEGYYETH